MFWKQSKTSSRENSLVCANRLLVWRKWWQSNTRTVKIYSIVSHWRQESHSINLTRRGSQQTFEILRISWRSWLQTNLICGSNHTRITFNTLGYVGSRTRQLRISRVCRVLALTSVIQNCVLKHVWCICLGFDKAFNLLRSYHRGFDGNFLERVKYHHPIFAIYHVACCRDAMFHWFWSAQYPYI